MAMDGEDRDAIAAIDFDLQREGLIGRWRGFHPNLFIKVLSVVNGDGEVFGKRIRGKNFWAQTNAAGLWVF